MCCHADYCDTYLTHDSVRPHTHVHLHALHKLHGAWPTLGPLLTLVPFVTQPVVRKQHNTGFKHKVRLHALPTAPLPMGHLAKPTSNNNAKTGRVCFAQANVRNYYMMFEQNQTQGLIDNKLADFETKSRDNFQAQVGVLHSSLRPAVSGQLR